MDKQNMIIGEIDVVGTAQRNGDLLVAQIQLEGFGVVEVDNGGVINFIHHNGEIVRLLAPADLLRASSYIEYAFEPSTWEIFLVNWAGDNIYLFDVQKHNLCVIDQFDRSTDDDPGLYRLNLFYYHNSLLIIYESGLFCFERNGKLRWKQHSLRDWFFDEVNGEVVWYESEFEGRWGYSIKDGSRL